MPATIPQFDRRASILKPTTTRDAAGGVVETYAEAESRWCRRADQGGAEFRYAGQLRAETTALFKFRYFTGLSEKDRIRCESRDWDIVSINEVGRRQFLHVQAKEREGQV